MGLYSGACSNKDLGVCPQGLLVPMTWGVSPRGLVIARTCGVCPQGSDDRGCTANHRDLQEDIGDG